MASNFYFKFRAKTFNQFHFGTASLDGRDLDKSHLYAPSG